MREQLAIVVAALRGSGWRGAAFCRDCHAEGDADPSVEAFVALAHRCTCPVRLAADLAASQAREAGLLLLVEELKAQAWHLTASMDTIVRELQVAVAEGDVMEEDLYEVLMIAKGTLDQYAGTADHAFVPCTHGGGCSNEWCHHSRCPLRPDRHVSAPQADAILAHEPAARADESVGAVGEGLG